MSRPLARVVRPLLALSLAALALAPRPARAQFVWRPDADWRTLDTPHFTVVFPNEFSDWARTLAERLESVRSAVGSEVGSVPRKRVTILITDPYSVSNGSASPFLESPAIVLWPTPPDPRSMIGDSRSWPELLAVHEFAHVAHLARPSRNPQQRLLTRLAPLGIGPITRRAPRWVIEGYATYLEGRLTGSGRPHGVWRPAVLRVWALEGRLPTYGQLSSWNEYQGRAFAYLAGSAFLEWLAASYGDSTLNHVWRRLSARTDRSFDDAFAGVYGESPRALYGRFTVALTAKAVEAAKTAGDSTRGQGQLVQRLAWTTGDPAVSPDGERVAVVLRTKDRPSRIVIWKTADEPPDTAAAARRAKAAKRDPEDVPARQFWPRPKKPVATLGAANGFAYDTPRFLADNRRLLVTRNTVRADGTVVPDLFEWDTKTKRVRRVTRSAGIQSADPSPDGRTAAAVRCAAGRCDLVRIDLATGAVEILAAGSAERAFYRPRWSPDGRTIAAAVSDSGRWRLVTFDPRGLRYVGPADSVNRYDAEYTPSGALLHVSEQGGVPNIALLDPATGTTRTLTRAIGAAVAPSMGGARDVWFLSLQATGYDVRRIALDPAGDVPPLALDPRLAPVAQAPVIAADTFPRAPLGAARPYGLGRREFRFLAGYSLGADGEDGVLGVASTDKVGRLVWIAQGASGRAGRPEGGALSASWRGWPMAIGGELFAMSRDASRQKRSGFTSRRDDIDLRGATLAASRRRSFGAGGIEGRIGGSLQQLDLDRRRTARTLGFASLGAAGARRGETRFLAGALELQGTRGRSADTTNVAAPFTRGIASAMVTAGGTSGALRVEGSYGAVDARSPFEQFVVGGSSPSFIDTTTVEQWIPVPALPFGTMRGRRYASYRASLRGDTFSPYFWSGAAGGSLDHWMRIVGIDGRVNVDPLPFFRTPGAIAVAGIGYSLDEPWRRRTRAYLALRFRP